MKKLTLAFGILLITAAILAQAPQSFKYQAIARDNSGNILESQNVGIRINILQGSAAGLSVYMETHNIITNQYGLFSINIGQGTTTGDFSSINWGTNTYFIKTEMDTAGGSAYALMGISQLLSVPYALYSENTENIDDADADPSNEIQNLSKQGNKYILSISNDTITATGASSIDELSDGKTGGNSVFLGAGSGSNDDGTDNRNTGLGNSTLHSNTNGAWNTATGYSTLILNSSGDGNSAYGYSSLAFSTTGDLNTSIGHMSSYNNTSGECNTVLGAFTNYYNQTGSNNTIIGYDAGKGSSNHNKSGNIFLGYKAGFSETGSNKLYIENSSSSSPLIYGDFDNDLLRVNGELYISNAYHFPTVDGSNQEVLTTNGSGVVSWASGGAKAINDLSDAIYDGSSVFIGDGSGISDDNSDNKNTAIGRNALHDNWTGSNNTAGGFQSLVFNTTGSDNTAFGAYSLTSITAGSKNTAFGSNTLGGTSGNDNVAIGYNAMQAANNTGSGNVSIGSHSLRNNTSGQYNVALGDRTSQANTSGSNNTNLGSYANNYNQGGSYNTIVGCEAGSGTSLHSKSGNVFIGFRAGFNETSDNKLYIENSNSSTPLIYGDFSNNLLRIWGTLDINNQYQFPTVDGSDGQVLKTNGTGTLSWSSDGGASSINELSDGKTISTSIFLGAMAGANDDGNDNRNAGIGINALRDNTSGFNNTASGYGALYSNTTGYKNSAFGNNALYSNTTGYFNIAIGNLSLYSNSLGTNNTAVGNQSLFSNTTGYANVANGSFSLYSNTTGDNNSATGYGALYSNTTGSNNTAIGNNALHENISGNGNTASGKYALNANTIGYNNTATGYLSLNKNIDGFNNVATGQSSLYENLSGDNNTATGVGALLSNTGDNNTATGYYSLYSNTSGELNVADGDNALHLNTTGYCNSAVGSKAMYANSTGKYNTAIGYSANFYNQTGDRNTCIGYNAGKGTSFHNSTGNVIIGSHAGLYEHGSNKLYIANSSGLPLIYGEFDNDFAQINGNFGVGVNANSFGSGTNTLAFYYTTTPPSFTAYNSVLLYSKWNASNYAELYVLDEQGNETVLSPHNFDMINKSEPMAWAFYSKNAKLGKEINVDMLKAIRVLENISGEKLVCIKNINDLSKMTDEKTHTKGIIENQREKIIELECTVADLISRIEKLEKGK